MDQLEEVRQKIDLVGLIADYVQLKKAGRNFKALCPFHSETLPSFMVSSERQIWKCFGCGKGGDAFRFLMEIEGMEFAEALRTLAKRAGIKLKPFRPSPDSQRKQLIYEINHLTAEFYHYLLLKHPLGKKALDYILGRGIKQESLRLFKLGYAPAMWDGLQKFLVGKKHYQPLDLEAAGLIIKGDRGFYDRFRDRLMFPLSDHQGNLCGFAGRVLIKDAQEAKYINSPETLVYHKSRLLFGLWQTRAEIKKKEAVVLVEGELDAISSYQAGVKNVVAIKGSALTEDQLNLLKRFSENLILALDADVAGDAAARRGIELADRLGFNLKVVEIKGGKDPDEIAQKNPALWQKIVTGAVAIYDYFLDSAFSRFPYQTVEGKRKIGQELVPLLAKINDKIVQSHYINQLADRLEIDQEAVAKEMEKFSGSSLVRPVISSPVQPIRKKRQEVLEEYLLALCFQSGQWSFLVKKNLKRIITNPAYWRIIDELKEYRQEFKIDNSQELAKRLPAELIEIFNNLYLLDFGPWFESEEKVVSEINQTIKELKKIKIKTKLGQIADQMKKLEKSNTGQQKLRQLNEEYRDLSAKLAKV